MWRRSHDQFTAEKSGTDLNDYRGRLVHFIDQHSVVDTANTKSLAITQS